MRNDSMKRDIVAELALLLLLLLLLLGIIPSNNSEQNQIEVYSFSAKNEQFAISNGVIVLNADENVFYGGNLEVIDEELFTNIKSHSTTFYTTRNGETHIVLSSSVEDVTNESVNVEGGLGKVSSDNLIAESEVEIVDELLNNLWFELKTIDANNNEKTYRLQLTLTKIS